MYALLILDIQVGLVHGQEKPWRCEEMLETMNTLMDKAHDAGAPISSRATSALLDLRSDRIARLRWLPRN
jgi:hypothetical protein